MLSTYELGMISLMRLESRKYIQPNKSALSIYIQSLNSHSIARGIIREVTQTAKFLFIFNIKSNILARNSKFKNLKIKYNLTERRQIIKCL